MALSFNTGLKNVAISYSKLLNLKITSDTISSAIEEHPFYPSLLSLSDTFENFNCNGFAYKISKDSILNVQCPFIAYVSIPRIGNDFVLIHEINSVSTIYSYNSNKRIKQDSKLFLESFQEIIYIIDSCSAFIEHNYINNLNRNNKAKANEIFWYALVSVVIFSFILLGKPIKFPVYFFTFLIIKIVGLIIAFALISYESNQQNSFIKNICSFGKYTNCQAVLNSKASKIFGVSWAELGLIFFSSSFLFLLFPSNSMETRLYLLSFLGIFSSSYIIFSLYYQWKILKQWCPLCLAIQFILLCELCLGLIYLLNVNSISGINWEGIMYTIIITFLLPVLLWIKLNKLLKKVLERNLYYFSFRRIQKNPQVFEALLKQQEIAPEGWEELGIEIGNPKAKNVFITVCNPYCVPCASAHTILEEIIAKNDNFRLKIIFNCLDEKSSKVAKHFIELSQNNNAILKQTLDDWYTNSLKRSNINITNFNKDFFSKNIDDHMNQMNIWCKKAVITFTPTIYLNGHKLPDNYMIKDLLDIAKSS